MAHDANRDAITSTYVSSAPDLWVMGMGGLAAMVVAFLAVSSGLSLVGAALGLLGLVAAGYFVWRGQREVAFYLAGGVVFALVVFAVANFGSESVVLFSLPLFIAASGVLLAADEVLLIGVLSTLSFDLVAYVQTQQSLAYAEQISDETFVWRAVVGSLALLAFSFLSGAGTSRWERTRREGGQRSARLNAALEMAVEVAGIDGLDKRLLDNLVDFICEQFGYEHAQVFLIGHDGRDAVLRASTGEMGAELLERGHRVAVGSSSVIGQVVAAAGWIVAVEGDGDEVRQRNELLPGNRSELALPLLRRGRVIGALDVQSRRREAFSTDDIETLQKVADQIAIAVGNLEAVSSETQMLESGSPTFLAGRELAATIDPNEVLAIVRQHMVRDVDRLDLVRLDRGPLGGSRHTTLAVWDRDDLALEGVNFDAVGLNLDDPTPGTRIIEDVRALPDTDVILRDLLAERLQVRTFAAFALPVGDEIVGYLLVHHRELRSYEADEWRALDALCGQIGVAAELFRLHEAIARHGERLSVLGELSAIVAGMEDVGSVRDALARVIGRLVDYVLLSVALVEPDAETASMLVLGQSEEVQAGSRLFPLEDTVIGAVVETVASDVTFDLSESRFKDHQAWRAEGVFGAVVAPLKTRDIAIGTLNVGFAADALPEPEDVGVLEQLAGQIGAALDNVRLSVAEGRRRSEVSSLLDIAQTTGFELGLSEVLGQVSMRAAQVCAVDRCTIFLLERDGYQLQPITAQFADGHADETKWRMLKAVGGILVDEIPVFRQALRQLQPVIVEDASQEDLVPRIWTEPYGIFRLAVVPLVRRDEAVGLMVLDYMRSDGRFGQGQIDLALMVGSQVAAVIENARLAEQLQQSMGQVAALYEASAAIHSAQDKAELLKACVVHVASMTDADRVRVLLAGPDPHRNEALQAQYLDEVAEWVGEKTENYQTGKRYDPSDVPLLDRPLLVQTPVVVNDVERSKELSEPMRRGLKARGVGALAVLPLVAGQMWLGAVLLERHHGRVFDDELIRLGRSMVGQTALALDAQLLLESRHRMARHEQILGEISTRLRESPNAESVLHVAVEELNRALGTSGASAHLNLSENAEEN